MLIFNIRIFYLLAGRNGFPPIIVASISIRFATMMFLVVFVLLNYADAAVIPFGLLDVATAVWTLTSLRADARAHV